MLQINRGLTQFTTCNSTMILGDCLQLLGELEANSIHGVITDPPYGLVEYRPNQITKMRNGHGGVWRIPPSLDGVQRSPIPRFTTLTSTEIEDISEFFQSFGRSLLPILVPGAHVLVASNPLLSHYVSAALSKAGLERRGEIVRLVSTLRGGDRPKNAHEEFPGVTVMPKSSWEPWLLFRRPIEGTVADNLRKWGTGGLRRTADDRPFSDVIKSHPTNKRERQIANHPSLKPQSFLRQVVHAILPLGKGIILDPFAGSGSTLAAANAIGYKSIGIEVDPVYFEMSRTAIGALSTIHTGQHLSLSL